MSDMLVNLYQLPETAELYRKVEASGVRLVGEGWVSETRAALTNHPTTCFIAVKDHKVIGFADYDATAKGYFGPTGVAKSERGQGIGAALLLKCLEAMREDGYGYAIIGSAGPGEFYTKCCGARVIENDQPNIYSRMV